MNIQQRAVGYKKGVIISGKRVLPEKAVITPAKLADKTQMDALVVDEEGALNVFDRAYVGYKKFDSYCEKGTRLNEDDSWTMNQSTY